jgi:predicted nucleotidyltransferase
MKRQVAKIQALGATSLYLFGSAARGEAGPESDIDLFVDYDASVSALSNGSGCATDCHKSWLGQRISPLVKGCMRCWGAN